MKASRWFLGILIGLLLSKNCFAGTLVQFQTSLGEIDVELYDKDKPITVKNFLQYVQYGLYNNSIFHRDPIISGTVTDFVAQGGLIYVADYGTPDEGLAYINTFAPIVDEYASNTIYSNLYGTIAMAQAGSSNSATSSWFFNLTNNPSLDSPNNGPFCVFGHVVRGTNILNQFIGRSYGSGLYNFSALTPDLSSLPVNYTNSTMGPGYSNLYYVSINALAAQITAKTNGSRQISWTSVNGLTNNVEYSTNLPPTWHVLVSTNGNGNQMSVMDTNNIAHAPRYYRIHVLF